MRVDVGWTGAWVADRLGIEVVTTHAPLGLALDDVVGLAVRRNPRRAHLLVSRLLGKHVPTDPRVVDAAGLVLGELVRSTLEAPASRQPTARARLLAEAVRTGSSGSAAALGGLPRRPGSVTPALVLGYAETATALGQCVADALGAPSLHSTRRRVPGVPPVGVFEEEHSHATTHVLLPADPAWLAGPEPLVLVDDELSTGRTVLNTIAELHALAPRDRYVVATLVDVRTPDDRRRTQEHAAALGTRIDVVALVSGEVVLPPDVVDRGQAALAAAVASPAHPRAGRPVPRRLDLAWGETSETGRHGVTPDDGDRLDAQLRGAVEGLAAALEPHAGPADVLVLGTEELMYVPLRLAAALADHLGPRARVRCSTTTRSPVLAVDDPGYAIRSALTFPAHDAPDDGPGPRFTYNLGSATHDVVLVVVDAASDTAALWADGGLLDVLGDVARDVVLVALPDAAADRARSARRDQLPPPLHGPGFGSYHRDEVAWLLTDLSGVALEAPTEEREEAIQSAAAHYAESLPIEYQPTAEYGALFEAALAETASRLAHAVGVVTELVLQARSGRATLVSLARAGTPVGILMRRWAQAAHGVDLPHYTVSIVRGRGIDPVALRYLAAHHDVASVMFVDGWTGKGAIARELAAALAVHARRTGAAFPDDLAVLADPGRCVRLYGTREDYLIPSACLNSTVSGLVSRTVLNTALLGPDQFHGAKFYAELAGADVSARFLDAVSSRFAEVAADVDRDWRDLAAADRTPDWAGWAAVERIAAAYGIGDLNLVKPGVGETTRVLLRRVPWKVLVRPDADLGHIRHLADERGVPVEEVADLPYSCVGLIHPQFTRGATGASGRAVS